jgi:hypothetical protein
MQLAKGLVEFPRNVPLVAGNLLKSGIVLEEPFSSQSFGCLLLTVDRRRLFFRLRRLVLIGFLHVGRVFPTELGCPP